MNKLHNNQSGFGLVEGLLITLVLAVISFGGYYVWHSQQSDKVSYDSASEPSTASNPQKGLASWKSGSLQYEKIAYKYPADWTLVDSSSHPKSQDGCTYPGNDEVTLTSPSHEQVIFRTGIYCIGDGGAVAFGAVPVKAFGQNLYIAFENNAFMDEVVEAPSFACLAKSTSPSTPMDFQSKHIFTNDGGGSPSNYFCYYPYSETTRDGAAPTATAEGIKASKDFDTAQKIFESLRYEQ